MHLGMHISKLKKLLRRVKALLRSPTRLLDMLRKDQTRRGGKKNKTGRIPRQTWQDGAGAVHDSQWLERSWVVLGLGSGKTWNGGGMRPGVRCPAGGKRAACSTNHRDSAMFRDFGSLHEK